MKGILKSLAAAAALWLAFPPAGAWSITREEIISCAKTFVGLDWSCGRKNANPQFNQLQPGKSYNGVSYNWGGFDQPRDFLGKIESGKIAGNYKKRCGKKLCIRNDFAGLDCSGFISRCWQVRRYSTQAFPAIAIKVPRKMLKPGDILNSRNKHVVLFDSFDEEGEMWVYESSAWVRQKGAPPAGVVYRTVNLGDEYVPRRFYKFIHIGDRIRTERPVTARERFGGGKRRAVPEKTAGTLIKGPEFKGKASSETAPSEVWYFIAFDDGTKGWCTLRDLILIEEAKPPFQVAPSV
jgi:hypothetical protein